MPRQQAQRGPRHGQHAILLTSSLTMALAITAVQRGKLRPPSGSRRRRCPGLVFLVNKYFEWSGHIPRESIQTRRNCSRAPRTDIVLRPLLRHDGLHGCMSWAACPHGIMLSLTMRQRLTGSDHVRLGKRGSTGICGPHLDIPVPLFYLIT